MNEVYRNLTKRTKERKTSSEIELHRRKKEIEKRKYEKNLAKESKKERKKQEKRKKERKNTRKIEPK